MSDDTAALRRCLQALLDAVEAAGPEGVPAGILYAYLMDVLSLDQFRALMGALTREGCVRHEGDVYTYRRGLPC